MGKIDNEKDHLAILSICSGVKDVFNGEYDFRKRWSDMSLIGEKIYISESIQKLIFFTGYTTLLEVLKGEDVDDILNRTGNPKGSFERQIKDYFDRNPKHDPNDTRSRKGFYALHFGNIIKFKQPLSLFELSKLSPGFALSPDLTYVKRGDKAYWVLTEWGNRVGPDCEDPINESRRILVEARRKK